MQLGRRRVCRNWSDTKLIDGDAIVSIVLPLKLRDSFDVLTCE
jgi:hypothetical protein